MNPDCVGPDHCFLKIQMKTQSASSYSMSYKRANCRCAMTLFAWRVQDVTMSLAVFKCLLMVLVFVDAAQCILGVVNIVIEDFFFF